MKIRIKTLKLICKKSEELIDFSPHVTFFHGKISSGKSSIVRLIDFCLGGDLERTPALQNELVAVQLSLIIGDKEVLLEREAQGSNQIRATWAGASEEKASVLAPIASSPQVGAIWNENIYNFSDLMFYLLGSTPIKVRRSKQDAESPLIRLSFRDLMWYCYLEQDHIDSSFYKLEDPIRGQKSKDVMRFILGHYTEILNDLEITLDNVSQEKSGMADSIKNFRKTLKEFGYDDGGQIYDEIGRAKSDIGSELKKMEELRTDYKAKTHFVDRLRDKLRECSEYVAKQQEIAFDLKQKIKEQEALIAELMATKFKLARTKHSSEILSSIQFKKCPACGKSIRLVRHGEADCHLCGIPHSTEEPQKSLDVEVINKDLDSRQDDLETSINGHKKALKRHEQIVQEAIAQKGSLEVRLRDELKNYDSNFLSDSREAERNLATLEERIRGLERLAKIPNIIQGLEADLVKKFVEEKSLKEKIESEKKKLNVFAYVEEIQNEFLAFLLKVGLPGVSADDKVLINHVTWVPSVLTGGAIGLRWSFFNAGSGGKKTLFNACYALALHVVTSANDMPLPGFLIIDTPMKNIGEEVNKSIFVNFYNLVYDLSVGPLKDTQIILVDKEYIKPTVDGVEIKEKYMTPDDEEYPPLISYYRGP